MPKGQSLHLGTSSHALSLMQEHHFSNSPLSPLPSLSLFPGLFVSTDIWCYFFYLKKNNKNLNPLPVQLLPHYSALFRENLKVSLSNFSSPYHSNQGFVLNISPKPLSSRSPMTSTVLFFFLISISQPPLLILRFSSKE